MGDSDDEQGSVLEELEEGDSEFNPQESDGDESDYSEDIDDEDDGNGGDDDDDEF